MPSLRQLGLFITESCNLACPYCFAANMERSFIDEALAREAIDLLLSAENTPDEVGLTFWGGEPLLAFELITRLVGYAEPRAAERGKRLGFALPTNLTLLTETMVDFFQAHDVRLSLSLDGGPATQGRRQTAKGGSSWPVVEQKLKLIHRRYAGRLPAVRMTVAPDTARELADNVRFFLEQGFRQVYFAPVVEAEWDAEALDAYEQGQLELVPTWLEALESGQRLGFTSWDKALAWREARRRDPQAATRERSVICGAGTAMLAVDIHGQIYPCHRFVFYDKQRRTGALGSLATGWPAAEALRPYERLDPARLGTAERLCAACEDALSCLAVCPALNYSLGGAIDTIDPRQCTMALLDARVAAAVEAQAAGSAAFARYVEDYLLKVYTGPGGLSASVTALFSRLEEADADALAERAAAILEGLGRPGRPDRSGGPSGAGR
jgi:uncharacterized protein